MCRFLKPLQLHTTIVVENDKKKLLTARNKGLVNAYCIQVFGDQGSLDTRIMVTGHQILQHSIQGNLASPLFGIPEPNTLAKSREMAFSVVSDLLQLLFYCKLLFLYSQDCHPGR